MVKLQWLTIQVLVVAIFLVKETRSLKTCEYPAVYGFGDSLIDVGNSIAALPRQFAVAEVDPYGIYWPLHAADRLSDGKLFVDFVCKLNNHAFPYYNSQVVYKLVGVRFSHLDEASWGVC